ncbi:MAG: hypothetical protein QUS14_16435 [Pyrinomonadaceae bacterium]|nr:hypothetical protein [Pyrinomonadaceae bacterium]
MAFDKTNAMRNAERYLAQGKIRSAITEYRHVVQNDPKDFVTMNMLGDLCVKDGDTAQALKCYKSVAEHYSKQGFAAKAIAVYNKIAKVAPYSPEIAENLAELHKMKGSISEAREHYTSLADHYERSGRKLDSLAVWKKIAYLDKNNTNVLGKLGKSYLAEGEREEAIEAFNTLGERLNTQSKFAEAVEAYEQSMAIDERNHHALAGYAEAMRALDQAADAAARLEAIGSAGQYDPEVAKLLFDCYLAATNASEAERVLLRLVEFDQSEHGRFLRLARLYLEKGETGSASRSLQLSSEHLLVAGRGEEVRAIVDSVLEAEPTNVESLRVLCDIHTWQRDEPALLAGLKRLAEAAGNSGSVHDERYALSQIVLIAPQEPRYAERLRELNEANGFEIEQPVENGFDAHFGKHFAVAEPVEEPAAIDFDISADIAGFEVESFSPEAAGFTDAVIEEVATEAVSPEAGGDDPKSRLFKEIESIKFYVDNGYAELAVKAADELKQEFGVRAEIDELYAYINGQQTAVSDEPAMTPDLAPVHEISVEPETAVEPEITVEEPAPFVETPVETPKPAASPGFDLSDLTSELGFEDEEDTGSNDSDYETHYNTATAYQEMGLLEMAINEYQSAIGLVAANDGSRRFFQCANMLGHCFIELGRPNLALTWFQRALETPHLDDDEKQALWYEIANSYQADGDHSNAARYFEKVYAENINFRDVGDRLKSIAVPA